MALMTMGAMAGLGALRGVVHHARGGALTSEHTDAAAHLMHEITGKADWHRYHSAIRTHDKLTTAMQAAHAIAPLHGAGLKDWIRRAKPVAENELEVVDDVNKRGLAHFKYVVERAFNGKVPTQAKFNQLIHKYKERMHKNRTAYSAVLPTLSRRPVYRHDANKMYAELIRDRPLFGYKKGAGPNVEGKNRLPHGVSEFVEVLDHGGRGRGLAGGSLTAALRAPIASLAGKRKADAPLPPPGPIPIHTLATGSQAALEALTPPQLPNVILYNFGGNSKRAETVRPGGKPGGGGY